MSDPPTSQIIDLFEALKQSLAGDKIAVRPEGTKVVPPALDTVAAVTRAVSARSFHWSNENDLQLGIASAFEEDGIAYEREVRLSDRDRVDFLVGDVALEVKIGGSPWGVVQQLSRYAEHDRVGAVVLVTTSLRLGCPLPELNGKPAAVVRIPAIGRIA